MSTTSPWSDALQGVLTQSPGGIAGLVDRLLTVCQKQGLDLDWQIDHWRLRSAAQGWHELPGMPLRKSVFRAILARLAVLCNCSPYGGKGEIVFGANPATVFHVVFANTAQEQRFELTQYQSARSPLGGSLMFEVHPLLAGLLAEVPRLRDPLLRGWTQAHLVPSLRAIPDQATASQEATALDGLRKLLRKRGEIDPWLKEIAELGPTEYAGNEHALTSFSKQESHIPLPVQEENRFKVAGPAQQLADALSETPAKAPPRPTPSGARPDKQ